MKIQKEIFRDDVIMSSLNEIESLNSKDWYINDSSEVIEKDFPYETEKLEEALNFYVSEKDP